MSLAAARAQAHRAAQYLALGARATLSPAADDSHTALRWDPLNQALVSDGVGAALSVPDLQFLWGAKEVPLAGLSWADGLAALGLQDGTLPYELPADVAAVDAFARVQGLAELADWYDLAQASLSRQRAALSSIDPGPSPVRVWPHHFDIATYVALEAGDPETARGIGIGFSPGDESYAQPYFYVNPWPMPQADALPAAPAPGHWHTEGFVGAVLTADALGDGGGPVLDGFLEDAVAKARAVLSG